MDERQGPGSRVASFLLDGALLAGIVLITALAAWQGPRLAGQPVRSDGLIFGAKAAVLAAAFALPLAALVRRLPGWLRLAALVPAAVVVPLVLTVVVAPVVLTIDALSGPDRRPAFDTWVFALLPGCLVAGVAVLAGLAARASGASRREQWRGAADALAVTWLAAAGARLVSYWVRPLGLWGGKETRYLTVATFLVAAGLIALLRAARPLRHRLHRRSF